MRQLKSWTTAAWTAPLIVPVLIILSSLAVDHEFADVHQFITFVAGLTAYAGSFLLGYPLAIALDKYGLLSVFTLILIGLACGAITGLLIPFAFPRLLGPYSLPPIEFLLIFMGCGALVAITFGLLAKVRWW